MTKQFSIGHLSFFVSPAQALVEHSIGYDIKFFSGRFQWNLHLTSIFPPFVRELLVPCNEDITARS